jgi:hypothetical protein
MKKFTTFHLELNRLCKTSYCSSHFTDKVLALAIVESRVLFQDVLSLAKKNSTRSQYQSNAKANFKRNRLCTITSAYLPRISLMLEKWNAPKRIFKVFQIFSSSIPKKSTGSQFNIKLVVHNWSRITNEKSCSLKQRRWYALKILF